ncbi:hypothetical protein [Xanthobacter dioxanivorans]|nr:hypothetical protein [Xanthobacter dioxanivorans]
MRAVIRLVAVAALALGLSGCDKCGNWFGQGRPGACQSTTPK